MLYSKARKRLPTSRARPDEHKEIEGVIAAKVRDGEWEFLREGGETEMTRGIRRSIIHVVGDACFT